MTTLKVTPYSPAKGLSEESAELILKDSDFNAVTYKEGTTVLSFFGCRFLKLTIENTEDINFRDVSISFFDCYIADLQIKEFTSKNISIGFYGSIVSGKIENKNLLYAGFNNCLVANSFFLITVPKVRITYTKENIQQDHWESLCRQLAVSGVQLIVSAPIRYNISGAKDVYCSSNFEGAQKNRFTPSLTLTYDTSVDHTETKITGIVLRALSISGSPAGKISVENTNIDSWYIYDFYPTGDVSFYNIAPASLASEELKIGIHQCNLDKVWFDNVAFDKFPSISFFKTKFSKAIFTACDFPDNYSTFSSYFIPNENVHDRKKTPPNFEKAQYEIFLQLKKALEDTGNYYEAQKLQAISHDALKQVKAIPGWDRTILKINGWSNNHGLSIKQPFIGFFIFSIPVYILYLLSIGRIFNCNKFDANLIGYYFSFVDITHRPDFLVKEGLNGWSLFLDYAGKLVVGFFIFQFIAAFRKYGKK